MPKNPEEITSDSPKIVARSLSDKEMLDITVQTGIELAKQPKVKIKLRKEQDPKAPNYETCQINGYTFTIMKGVEVEVPQEVARILAEAGIY